MGVGVITGVRVIDGVGGGVIGIVGVGVAVGGGVGGTVGGGGGIVGVKLGVGDTVGVGVFVGVGNHMGGSEYYMVNVKFRNSTQSLPDIDGSEASVLPSLYEFRFFVGDGMVWEMPVSFGFEDVVVENDVLVVGDVIVDGVSFPVDVSAVLDVEGGGFVFQLFFELWRYDVVSRAFRFHDRFVGIWLSMTVS